MAFCDIALVLRVFNFGPGNKNGPDENIPGVIWLLHFIYFDMPSLFCITEGVLWLCSVLLRVQETVGPGPLVLVYRPTGIGLLVLYRITQKRVFMLSCL